MRTISMETQTFHNGRILTDKGELRELSFTGGVVADHGRRHNFGRTVDLEGDYLIPGLVELHTDNLEKHFIPRTGVNWPIGLSSVVAHDVHMVGSGVTTVFDAVTVGEPGDKHMRKELFHLSLDALEEADKAGLLRADHYLHLRCEVAGDDVVELVEPLLERKNLRLFSIMDHTPGQRQWRDLEEYKRYSNLQHEPEDRFQERIGGLRTMQEKNARGNIREIVEICRKNGFPLASHDDTTVEQVRETAALDTRISEFPTTLEAAREAGCLGMVIVMGAPNVVRGGSHSGNVAAVELACEGLLDILSSDYMPASLLHAAFLLPELAGMTLAEALRTVTLTPAAAVGLEDRGELAPGKRADAVRVKLVNGVPMVRSVWREGMRVL
ncbi:MAG: alpha-D-ribose 1-methylphosphonate 5-triphosphate diphosphatase [Desulfovibrio sp.]|nr:alpha-D-ribose 1-methylphosphonate 5-triphosphate diphosphatase [Desulfovibrio sp.]